LLKVRAIVCAKTGMLPTRSVVIEVARLFRETDLPRPVVDPVIMSSSGHRLMEEDAVRELVNELMPLASLVTPNIPEAEKLTGISIQNEADMRHAAEAIQLLGARAVLVKGGHRHIDMQALDVLLAENGIFTEFRSDYIDAGEVHGSGCTLSAAIAAGLGRGLHLEEAVAAAKKYVTDAIRNATRIGHGAMPL